MICLLAPGLAGVTAAKLADDLGKPALRPAWGGMMALASSQDAPNEDEFRSGGGNAAMQHNRQRHANTELARAATGASTRGAATIHTCPIAAGSAKD